MRFPVGCSVARECARCARAQTESGARPAPTRSSFNARRAAASSDSACANWPRARTTSCSRYFRKTSASLFKATSAASRLVAAEIRRCLYRSKSASARCSWSLVIGRVVSSCWRLPRNRMTRRSEAVVIATKVQPAMADCPKNAPTAAIPHATTTPPRPLLAGLHRSWANATARRSGGSPSAVGTRQSTGPSMACLGWPGRVFSVILLLLAPLTFLSYLNHADELRCIRCPLRGDIRMRGDIRTAARNHE